MSTSRRCGSSAATSGCPTAGPTRASPRPRCSPSPVTRATSRSGRPASTSSTAPASWPPAWPTWGSPRPRPPPSAARSPSRPAPARRSGSAAMTRVVLVGGGYVTIHAYAAIARRLRRRLVARRGRGRRRHARTPATASTGSPARCSPASCPSSAPGPRSREACPLARVVHARVTGVDRGRQTVTYVPAGGEARPVDLRWDHLVIGTGSREPAARRPRAVAARLPAAGTRRHRAPLGPGRRPAARSGRPRSRPSSSPAVASRGSSWRRRSPTVARASSGCELVHSGGTLVPELAADQPRLGPAGERRARTGSASSCTGRPGSSR